VYVRAWVLTLFLWLGLAVSQLPAAEPTRVFGLPAGRAEESLEAFSEQTGVQIVYSLDDIRGVTTNAVKGDLALREALERLVAGTGLGVVQDKKTGAFVLKREKTGPTPSVVDQAKPISHQSETPSNPTTMKRSSLLVSLGTLARRHPPPAAAQSAAVDAKKESAVKLEAFVVTGSNIPTAADSIAVPVTILGQADLERSGVNTNLLDVLQKTVPSFAGAGNLGVTNGNTAANNTYGGSQVSLRSLSTLVLLDGRRVPDNGASARGSRAFVDVNQFPLAAIQTVEVLTDGASAIYGSDAIGGVVNVKLRHDFRGLEIGGRYAFSGRDGNYSERSGYLVAGVNRDRLSVTVSLSNSRLTPSTNPTDRSRIHKSARPR
jgi:iron complex outermembrane receptor protein